MDLVSVSVDTVHYKIAGRCEEIDPFLLDQWKAAALYQFVHRKTFTEPIASQFSLKTELVNRSDLGRFLLRRALCQYLTGSASWWNVQEPLESEIGCDALGHSLNRIICKAAPEQKPRPTSAISCPVLCIIGKPFAGKSTLAKTISEQLGFGLIDFHGSKIASGRTTLDYIKIIEEAAAPAHVKGVVLDGFPFSVEQARAFQEYISGRIIAVLNRNGFASRFERSDLVPYPSNVATIPQPPFSGSKITAVLHIDVDDQVALRRCLSKRIDPIDGSQYSMEGRVPEDKIVKERLQNLYDMKTVEMTLPESIYCLSSHCQAIIEYFNLFNIVYNINGNGETDSLVSKVAEILHLTDAKPSDEVEPNSVDSIALLEPEEIQQDYLDDEVTLRLYNCWVGIEFSYISDVHNFLCNEICSREPAIQYFASVVDSYQRFIERHDDRQVVIDKATRDYNDIDYVLRTEDIVKAELYARTISLESSLLALMDNKHKENEMELKRIEQSESFQKQVAYCLERCFSLLQAEISRHQMMFLFFSDIESCQGARWPAESPVIAFRADIANPSAEIAPSQTKKGTSSSAGNKQEPQTNVLDIAGSVGRAIDTLMLAGKSAIDLATAKDRANEPNLVKCERIITRNRIRRIITFGVSSLNKIKNEASRLLELLKSLANTRQQSEIKCCQNVISFFRTKIEDEVPMLYPIQIPDGISIVINESETIYDIEKDAIPSLFQHSSVAHISPY